MDLNFFALSSGLRTQRKVHFSILEVTIVVVFIVVLDVVVDYVVVVVLVVIADPIIFSWGQ